MPRVDTLSDSEAYLIDVVRAIVKKAEESPTHRNRELEDLFYYLDDAHYRHPDNRELDEARQRAYRLLW